MATIQTWCHEHPQVLHVLSLKPAPGQISWVPPESNANLWRTGHRDPESLPEELSFSLEGDPASSHCIERNNAYNIICYMFMYVKILYIYVCVLSYCMLYTYVDIDIDVDIKKR